MKICICTTPLRPTPTTFPPFGSMAIIQSLRDAGHEVSFLHIDYFRYADGWMREYFAMHQFDVVGISAVVSTAYMYTKYLGNLIREVSPSTCIVVGGNLAASAEILLRKCQIDFCVVGDGEIIIRNLVAEVSSGAKNFERLRAVKGICFLGSDHEFIFTGYGEKPPADQISWPDYGILESDGSLSHYISDTIDNRIDGTYDIHGEGARLATIVMTKGCVARCTFCHRWEKGFRVRPVDQVIAHAKFLKDRFNVRYLDIADENFGSDHAVARELADELGKLGMVWRCAGVRANTVDQESLWHWQRNGCTSVIFGFESGSDRILKIMEKKVTVEQNLAALEAVCQTGMTTVIQLVIGMPGETDDTIRETIDFLKRAAPLVTLWKDKAPSELISINYAQALPGTPLYEWAREHGYIGVELDEEEKYLIHISDTDAYLSDHFINYTGLPLLRVLMWQVWILAEIDAHHYRSQADADGQCYPGVWQIVRYYISAVGIQLDRGWAQGNWVGRAARWLIGAKGGSKDGADAYDYVTESGYFNVRKGFKMAPLLLNPITRPLFFPLLAVAMAAYKGGSVAGSLRLLRDYFIWQIGGSKTQNIQVESISLRKAVAINSPVSGARSSDAMLPLRQGR